MSDTTFHILAAILIILSPITNLMVIFYFFIRHGKNLKIIENLKLENIEKIDSIIKLYSEQFESLRVSVIDSELFMNKQWSMSENNLKEVLIKTNTAYERSSNSVINSNNLVIDELLNLKNNLNLILKKLEDERK